MSKKEKKDSKYIIEVKGSNIYNGESDRFCDELLNIDDDVTELEVRVASYGGCVSSALRMSNAIKLLDIPVKIIAVGTVQSAGVLILLASKDRYAMRDSWFMTHKTSKNEDKTVNWFKSLFNKKKEEPELVLCDNMVINSYVKETGLEESFVRDNLMNGENAYFNADKAKEYGFVKDVIE